MDLPYKPIPNQDESPGSLLLRASEHNGWQSISSFLTSINIDFYYGNPSISAILCNQDKWDSTCKAIGVNLKNTSPLCYKRSGVTIRSMVSFQGGNFALGETAFKTPRYLPDMFDQKRIRN